MTFVATLDAIEAVEKIEMPPGAAEFAVGRKLEANLFLLLDDLLDLGVLDLLEGGSRNLAFFAAGARNFQRLGA